ncbi:MAG: DUF11 domain-containing protein, partial [Methanobrevibacter sp.]|nr:DUF11 domain-containing protein [Methanobrevibacter sp.]
KINGTGNIDNIANVTVTEHNVGNNSTNIDNNFTIPPTVNLTITKTANIPVNVTVGSLVVYTITVTNHGPDNGTGVVVTDVIDHRLVYVNSVASKGTYDPVTGNWTIGGLNIGQTVQLNITVRVNGTGTIDNIANVTVIEVNIGMNTTDSMSKDVEFILPDTVNLTILKSASVVNTVFGSVFVYTITVTNYGPDNGTGVVVTDKLDYRLVYLGSVGDRGTVYDPVTGSWVIGDLASGESITLVISVRVNGIGNISNVVSVIVNEPNVGSFSSGISINARKAFASSTIVASGLFKIDKPVAVRGVARDEFANLLGNVVLKLVANGKTYSVTTNSLGSWTLTLTPLKHGNYNFHVSWGGNVSHFGFTNSTMVNIEKYYTIIDHSTTTISEGQNAKINVTLKDEYGAILANKKVTITINKKTYTGTTNSKGIAIFTVKRLKGKNHIVVAKFAANSYHHGSISSKVQVVKPKVDLSIAKIRLIHASNKRTKSQVAYYKVTIQNKGSLKSKSTRLLSWHIHNGIKIKNKYMKIKPLKGGQKKTYIFKYYPDRDHHKHCMRHQYYVLNPKKTMKEISYKNNKVLLIGKNKMKFNPKLITKSKW